MRKSFIVLTLILCSCMLIGFCSVDKILAATNNGAGTGNLSALWANVYVGNLTYEPFFGWTQSNHSFDIINMTGDAVTYTYEFQHGVWEILKKNVLGQVTQSRFINNSTQFLSRNVGPPTWYDELDGTQGVDCGGEKAGLYMIQAYTAVRASVGGGRLNVQVNDDTEFWILD